MKLKVLYMALCIMVTLGFSAHAQELRTSASVMTDLMKNLSGEVELELRKAFYPEPYYGHVFQGKVGYNLHKRWRGSVLYSFTNIKEHGNELEETGDETHDRHKFAADLLYQAKRFDNDLRISNRFRYQYATQEDKKPKEYLRDKITLDYRLSKFMNPYLAFEPYYHLRKGTFSTLRCSIGNELPLWGSTLELYYIAEINREPESYYVQYILGMTFKMNYKIAKQ